jgi:hypothetical protein
LRNHFRHQDLIIIGYEKSRLCGQDRSRKANHIQFVKCLTGSQRKDQEKKYVEGATIQREEKEKESKSTLKKLARFKVEQTSSNPWFVIFLLLVEGHPDSGLNLLQKYNECIQKNSQSK